MRLLAATAVAALAGVTPSVAFAPHKVVAPYQGSATIDGTATGGSGGVTILARPRDRATYTRVSTVTPVDGHWSLRVKPRVTTRYRALYSGAEADRLVYVSSGLSTRLAGRTLTVTVRPVPALGHLPVELIHLKDNHWGPMWIRRTSLQGVVVFRDLAPGRYYVLMDGGGLYGGAVSPRFAVRG